MFDCEKLWIFKDLAHPFNSIAQRLRVHFATINIPFDSNCEFNNSFILKISFEMFHFHCNCPHIMKRNILCRWRASLQHDFAQLQRIQSETLQSNANFTATRSHKRQSCGRPHLNNQSFKSFIDEFRRSVVRCGGGETL
jgi:hypothetical protein